MDCTCPLLLRKNIPLHLTYTASVFSILYKSNDEIVDMEYSVGLLFEGAHNVFCIHVFRTDKMCYASYYHGKEPHVKWHM